ncbi:MAG: OsmC family protein [Candidatus Hodarchaeota archaeon]
MSHELRPKVSLKKEEEMIYRCDLGGIKMQSLYIDESRKNIKEKIGPSPAKLLALSILSCLSLSFEFCLQKTGFILSDLNGSAEVIIARNDKDFWRIKKIDVNIEPIIKNPEMRKRADQCQRFFEQYCIISESLRKGIEINVNLDY